MKENLSKNSVEISDDESESDVSVEEEGMRLRSRNKLNTTGSPKTNQNNSPKYFLPTSDPNYDERNDRNKTEKQYWNWMHYGAIVALALAFVAVAVAFFFREQK